MASTLRSLIERVYPQQTSYRAVIAGLDASGKTTLLYRIKLGEVVTTIPTIGFNVEDLEIPLANNVRALYHHQDGVA